MNKKQWITTSEAAELFGVTQRYIQFLCHGWKRQKGKSIWYVEPKLKHIKYQMSIKNKQMMLIDKNELESLFTKEHENANH